jgi:gamma-glutamylcysteine synthetase
MLWGIEREALRLNTESQSVSLAETALSFSSNHKLQGKIVGDFSDTQVELITYPRRSWEEALEDLQQLHLQFYLEHPQEQLWPHSLPPQGSPQGVEGPGALSSWLFFPKQTPR